MRLREGLRGRAVAGSQLDQADGQLMPAGPLAMAVVSLVFVAVGVLALVHAGWYWSVLGWVMVVWGIGGTFATLFAVIEARRR